MKEYMEYDETTNELTWSNVVGDDFCGKVVDVDSNVLIVKCDDGVTRCVEC